MRLLKNVRALVVATGLAAALWPSGAHAEPLFCFGTIAEVYVTATGDVMALPSWRGQFIQYCNLDTTRHVVTPKTCAAWYATLLLAYQTQKSTVTADWTGQVKSCATWAEFDKAPTPAYFRLQ